MTASEIFNFGTLVPAMSEPIGYDVSNLNACTNCYFSSEINTNGSSLGIDLTQNQMKDLSNFSGFSLSNWKEDTDITEDYPVLIWQP